MTSFSWAMYHWRTCVWRRSKSIFSESRSEGVPWYRTWSRLSTHQRRRTWAKTRKSSSALRCRACCDLFKRGERGYVDEDGEELGYPGSLRPSSYTLSWMLATGPCQKSAKDVRRCISCVTRCSARCPSCGKRTSAIVADGGCQTVSPPKICAKNPDIVRAVEEDVSGGGCTPRGSRGALWPALKWSVRRLAGI